MRMHPDKYTRCKELACSFLKEEEALALHAYPDPASPLARALIKRFGSTALMRVGGNGVIPEDLAKIDGSPWTIGYGETGAEIVCGLVWTKAQAEHFLKIRIDKVYKECERIYEGIENLNEWAVVSIISLVYNRGSDLAYNPKDKTDRRSEMRLMLEPVRTKDYLRLAGLYRSMKRLWENKGLNGVVSRREREAKFFERAYEEERKK